VHGCRRWFNVTRDTVSDRILAVYPMGAPPPSVNREEGR
jgi:sarcosine oxidase delta subunit